jgi:primosomal protein N' (replication factor Y)
MAQTGLFGTDERRPPGGPGLYAHVALERGIERAAKNALGHGQEVDATLTYAVPPGTPVGGRVRVPLGKRNLPAEGIVVRVGGAELLGTLSPERVKPATLAAGAPLPAHLVELGVWLSGYYVCPLGMALSAMTPAAVKRASGRVTIVEFHHRAGVPLPAGAPAALKRVWAAVEGLDAGTFPASKPALMGALAKAVGRGVGPATMRKLIDGGLLHATSRTEVRGSAPDPAQGADAAEQPDDKSAPAPPTAGGARSAEERTLTAYQRAAVEGIAATLGRFAPHLLLGVTGSGKTEVYLQVIDRALRAGKQALALVPEIALTPQTSRRFVERFGAAQGVAVLHSGLSAAQRHAQWAACAEGRVGVVVGARSAVFAPLARLGVIVVDEEHDGSYKQDQLPRYHARDVAVKRAALLNCPIVLGSATPSLESWANAQPGPGAEQGKYALWRLPDRVGGGTLPAVEIADLAQERRARAAQTGWRDRQMHLLGPRLESSLDQTLAGGGQAILLLNRRGYANHLCCPDQRCGWAMHCNHCDATMVYHLLDRADPRRGVGTGYLRCHHCLAENLTPRACPECGKPINRFGLGTQRVEEELERKFMVTRGLTATGDAPTLARVDSDTMGTARDYFRVLDRFAKGEVRVLVGTQMIAKGLDFPNVRLVGVISADTALNLPDFRAAERTFQLVAQVAGRAGRGREPGRVIVQTMEPRAPSIVLAARHDFDAFAARELAVRARAMGTGLPPVGRMARIVCRDLKHERAQSAAAAVHAALTDEARPLQAAGIAIALRGPMPCPIARIANHHRFAVEVFANTRGVVQTLLGGVRRRGLLTSDAHTAVDVDPIALL